MSFTNYARTHDDGGNNGDIYDDNDGMAGTDGLLGDDTFWDSLLSSQPETSNQSSSILQVPVTSSTTVEATSSSSSMTGLSSVTLPPAATAVTEVFSSQNDFPFIPEFGDLHPHAQGARAPSASSSSSISTLQGKSATIVLDPDEVPERSSAQAKGKSKDFGGATVAPPVSMISGPQPQPPKLPPHKPEKIATSEAEQVQISRMIFELSKVCVGWRVVLVVSELPVFFFIFFFFFLSCREPSTQPTSTRGRKKPSTRFRP